MPKGCKSTPTYTVSTNCSYQGPAGMCGGAQPDVIACNTTADCCAVDCGTCSGEKAYCATVVPTVHSHASPLLHAALACNMWVGFRVILWLDSDGYCVSSSGATQRLGTLRQRRSSSATAPTSASPTPSGPIDLVFSADFFDCAFRTRATCTLDSERNRWCEGHVKGPSAVRVGVRANFATSGPGDVRVG